MRAQYTDQLITRAERDPEFRKRLSEEPKAAVQEELGVELPAKLDIRVIQEGRNEAIRVLPAATASGRLRDEELAATAGGSGASWCGDTNCSAACNCTPY